MCGPEPVRTRTFEQIQKFLQVLEDDDRDLDP